MKASPAPAVTVETLPLERLRLFPVAFFTVIMGLTGLALVYDRAHDTLGTPAVPGTLLAWLALALFGLIGGIYLSKLLRYPSAVLAEFRHPIKVNFFPAISISLMLLATAFAVRLPEMARLVWYGGAALHLLLTLTTVSFWLDHRFEIHHANPAWFIPIVGNVVAPVIGVEFAPVGVTVFFFAIGMLFWPVLLTVILYRLVFHDPLPDKLTPTLFILIAPPAVGCLAYFRLTGQFDLVAQGLYGLALFFTLLVLVRGRRFLQLPFFLSWWAFTFPLAAVTLATLLNYRLSGQVGLLVLAYALLVLTTLVVTVVAYQTLRHLLHNETRIYEQH